MKNFFFFVGIMSSFLFLSCSKHTPTDTGGEPVPPNWVELTIKVDSLPAAGKTGSVQFQFVVTGDGNGMPIGNDTKDTVNYIRVSFKPDPGRERSTFIQGDSLWEGGVRHLDTIILKTMFTPLKTTYIYFDISTDKYREFDWATEIFVEYYYAQNDSIIRGMGGYGLSYATFYVNTETEETFIKIHASKNN